MSGTDEPVDVSAEIALVNEANHQALVDPLLHAKCHVVSKLTGYWWRARYGMTSQHDEDVALGAAVALYCETYGWPLEGETKLPRAVEAGTWVERTEIVVTGPGRVVYDGEHLVFYPDHSDDFLKTMFANRVPPATPPELHLHEERLVQTALAWAGRFHDRYGPEVSIGSDDADLLEAANALNAATAKVLRDSSGVT